jgi:SAM-dependent methyltransferase
VSQPGQWQVAGSAPEVYERELVPAVFGEWAPIVVELAHPRPGERVVDVACGTGIVARIAAARVGPTGVVVGVDLNLGMLSVARSVMLTDSRSAAPIQWQEASADKLPFPGESFDIVYCQLGLQFFADRPAALREMRRVLGPEGRLALMVWRGIHESPGFAVLAASLEEHVVKRRQLSCARHLGYLMRRNWPALSAPPVSGTLQFNRGLGQFALLRLTGLC